MSANSVGHTVRREVRKLWRSERTLSVVQSPPGFHARLEHFLVSARIKGSNGRKYALIGRQAKLAAIQAKRLGIC